MNAAIGGFAAVGGAGIPIVTVPIAERPAASTLWPRAGSAFGRGTPRVRSSCGGSPGRASVHAAWDLFVAPRGISATAGRAIRAAIHPSRSRPTDGFAVPPRRGPASGWLCSSGAGFTRKAGFTPDCVARALGSVTAAQEHDGPNQEPRQPAPHGRTLA
jgi:hypothetical protein